jgi:hypothetical protein
MHSSLWLSRAFSAAACFFVAGMFLTSSLAAADRPASGMMAVEEIVVRVNGEIITRGELDKLLLQIEAGLRQQGLLGTPLDDAVKKTAADRLRDKIDAVL